MPASIRRLVARVFPAAFGAEASYARIILAFILTFKISSDNFNADVGPLTVAKSGQLVWSVLEVAETGRDDPRGRSIRAHQRQIRRAMLAQRRALPERERLERSQRVWQRLATLPWYHNANVILGYMAFDKEVLTDGLLRQATAAGKRVVVPTVQVELQQLVLYAIRDLERDVAPGFHGILEPRCQYTSPVDVEELELAIVPGVAFDLQGGRLGFGAGFYDRLLSRFPPGVPKVAIAYDFQIVPRLPRQSHDIALDAIVTESRVISRTPLSTLDGAAAVAWTTRTDKREGEG